LDGLYMGHPFRIAHAQLHNDRDTVADSLRQFDVAMDALLDPETGLYKHAFDEARQQPWSDKHSGHSPAFWARAIGWLAMGLVDVADLVGEDFAPLRERTIALLNTIRDLRIDDELWLQVIDRPDLDGNYQETSASAMFAYAFARGARLGLIEPQDGLTETLIKQSMAKNADGRLEMVEMCEVAGLGWYENRFRDGSAEYYVSEALASNDPKGVGPLMMTVALAQG
jgi:unsaturated rhamnogalacturonyl hydrolase